MEIKLKSQHLHLGENQKENIRAKVEKLTHLAERLSDESAEFRVEVKHEKSRKTEHAYSCQLTIFVPNAVIRAETRAESIENSVDECIAKIRKQIERYKAKSKRYNRPIEGIKEIEVVEVRKSEEFEIPKILRRKRFSKSTPITEEAAIEAMELLGHGFFHFNNADTGRFSVVYKRSDGYYGIIEPKLSTD